MSYLRRADGSVVGVSRRPAEGLRQVTDYLLTPAAEVVIHLAEEPDRANVNRLGESYLRHAQAVVRELCMRSGKVIYASSGTVYGDNAVQPFPVEAPVVETDMYSRLKIENERVVLESGGTVLRISNLYGRRVSLHSVFSDILKQIPGNGVLYVRDEQPVRDFLCVSDAAGAFGIAARSSVRGILNVGSGVGTSIGALARYALAAVGEDREVVATHPSGRQSFNVLAVDETKAHLGWSSDSSLVDYFSAFFANGAAVVAS
jgi:UDP-glucose 4-epimerase